MDNVNDFFATLSSYLWGWLTGVFGISTKYSEALLAIKYHVKSEKGHMIGGPMYTLERGLGWHKMGILFAVFTAIAAFGIGCTVQANAISTIMHASYGISTSVSGAVLMPRSLFSNESGLGSAPIVAAAARTKSPVRQAFGFLYWHLLEYGSVANLSIVWNIADCMNALMAIPNLLSLIFLNGVIVHETRKYLWRDRLDREMNEF